MAGQFTDPLARDAAAGVGHQHNVAAGLTHAEVERGLARSQVLGGLVLAQDAQAGEVHRCGALGGAVGAAIVHEQDFDPFDGVVLVHDRAQARLNPFGFVMRGDEHGDFDLSWRGWRNRLSVLHTFFPL